jgi:hypothetical protein
MQKRKGERERSGVKVPFWRKMNIQDSVVRSRGGRGLYELVVFLA